MINNAGIHDPGLFADLTADQFRTMLDVHFFGTLFVAKAAWPHFVRAGYGRVVNTVSDAMLGGFPELSSYGAAKAAVFGLTRNLATEGLPHGIRVNAIAPRAFTRLSASHSDKVAEVMSMSKETMDEINASMPPDLCAPAAAFLAHESCLLNGEVLRDRNREGGAHRCCVHPRHLAIADDRRGHRRKYRHHHGHPRCRCHQCSGAPHVRRTPSTDLGTQRLVCLIRVDVPVN